MLKMSSLTPRLSKNSICMENAKKSVWKPRGVSRGMETPIFFKKKTNTSFKQKGHDWKRYPKKVMI